MSTKLHTLVTRFQAPRNPVWSPLRQNIYNLPSERPQPREEKVPPFTHTHTFRVGSDPLHLSIIIITITTARMSVKSCRKFSAVLNFTAWILHFDSHTSCLVRITESLKIAPLNLNLTHVDPPKCAGARHDNLFLNKWGNKIKSLESESNVSFSVRIS